ncbi:MAG TPA: RidA family protein [Bauldia sp.]|nr:RidA family protein [Bauldia sp.]
MQHYRVGPRMAQLITHNGIAYLAGQVADNGKAGVEDQTRDVLAKVDALLAEAGTDKSKLLTVQVFLPNISDFAAMNTVYDAWIHPEKKPVRACIEARLAHPDLRVEVLATAAI